MTTETTIAILHHNRSFHLAQCVASIRQFTRTPYMIKVLDVGSDEIHKEHIRHLNDADCEVGYCEQFLSCLSGRRRLLRLVDTEFVVYLDDDIRVGPSWLSSLLRPMRNDTNAGASAANIVQEGAQWMSGCRHLERVGRTFAVRNYPHGYKGQCQLSHGGATLYRYDVIKETEYREEFSGGSEDWDQTLQITQDLKRPIYGSAATVFHRHLPECMAGYYEARWRWRELIEAAIGMYDRWRVRSAVDKVLQHFLKHEIVIPKDIAERLPEILT